jgi:uncharacterized delta-60 repeat protein
VNAQPRVNASACALLVLALLAALLIPTLAQGAKPGALDRSFGDDGWVRTPIGTLDRAADVAIDAKHRIVAAGDAEYFHVFAIARYRPGGRLDRSFSGNGKKTTRFSGGPGYVVSYARSVAIDSRGRIVAAGAKCNYSAPPRTADATLLGCEVALARYKRNGSLDSSFGGDGRVTTDLENGGATSVAIDSKDRIIVVGDNVVARYRQNGTLDPSFGYGGAAVPPGPTEDCSEHDACFLTSLAIDSRRRIVVAGYPDAYRFLVARFLPDGRPDPSFGNGGRVIRPEEGFPLAVAITSKNQVLAAGGTTGEGGFGNFRLDLYRSDGTRAQRWGDNGEITTSFRSHHHDSAFVESVGFDSRGRIVAIGAMGGKYALARYHRNGTLDRSFSGNGKATGAFKSPHRRDRGYVRAGTIDHRDRIVVAGDESRFLLARFIGDRRR